MAAYFDGRSAARREANLAFELDAVEVRDGAGDILARWPYASLRAAEPLAAGRPALIWSAEAPEARLALVEAEAIGRLRLPAPQLFRRADALSWRGLAGAAALAVGALAGLYFSLPLAARPVAKLIPLQWEAALGRQVAGAMSLGETCVTPAGAAALDKLVGRLAGASGFAPGFAVAVVADPRVNAFAVPGGRVVLLAGLLREAESPDEVAGVLAHEMGHVIERHPTAAALRLLGIEAVAAGLFGDGSALVSTLASAGGLMVALSYSRDDERDADRLAGELLDRAGISRAGLARFFDRLGAARVGATLPAYIGTHPPPQERAALFAQAPARPAALSPGEWAALKAICG